MKGQTVIGEFCAWCGEAAEGRLEVEAPHKEAGEWKDAREVPACGVHMASVKADGPMGYPMRRHAKGVEQLSVFEPSPPESAIEAG